MNRPRFSLDVSSLTNAASSAAGGAAPAAGGGSSVTDATNALTGAAGGGDIPPQMQEAETAIAAMVPASAQKYVAQGESLVNAAEAASKGDYSGLITAAEGLVNDFPPGDVREAVDDVLNVAGAAAKGEEIGQMLGPYGAVVGAVIGAIVGIVEDIFTGPPPVVQNDMRGAGDALIFPSVKKGTPFSVVPGAANRNPRDQNDSIFYTLDGVPKTATGGNVTNQNIAEDFGFAVSYISPPKSTNDSKYKAWLLAQVYLGNDDVSRAHALNPHPNGKPNPDMNGLPGRIEDVKSAKLLLGTLMGGPTYVSKLVTRVEQLYGSRKGWSTVLPSSLPRPNVVDPTMKNPGNPSAAKTPGWKAFYESHMLDWLYYPIYVSWNGSVYSACAPKDATDIFLAVDPTLLQICECAILGHNDVVVMHMIMAKVWLRKRGLLQDSVKMPGVDMSRHKNFSRIVGIVGERLRNTLRMHRALRAKAAGTPVLPGHVPPGRLHQEVLASRKAGFRAIPPSARLRKGGSTAETVGWVALAGALGLLGLKGWGLWNAASDRRS